MTRNAGRRDTKRGRRGLPDTYQTDRERRDQARAELRRVEAERLEAVTRGADVTYGSLDPTDPGVVAALAYDHAHGVRHRGLPCCEPQEIGETQ